MQDTLNNLDFQLEVMPEQNRLMVYLSVFLGLIAFSYYFFGISFKEATMEKEAELRSIEKKLSENKISIFNNQIEKTNTSILLYAKKYEEARFSQMSLRVKLEKMDYLSSDAKGLADILDRLLKNSVRLDVSIEKIVLDDTQKDYKAHIKERGSMTIEGNAKFTSILKLIHFIESQEALLEVEGVHFSLNEEQKLPSFTLIIRGYSIEL